MQKIFFLQYKKYIYLVYLEKNFNLFIYYQLTIFL